MHANPSSADILARLVGFDTTSRNSNLDLIAWVRDWLDGQGVSYRISTNPEGTKANLHAVVGPPVAGGVALSGHVDTVPVDNQAWRTDPHRLHAEDGRLYGRGTADMKGFVACTLAAVPRLRARNLAQPVHLFLTYDEEVGCSGARRLAADLAESGLRPRVCIVGEPSGMQPIVAHKGKFDVAVRVRGRAGHSSLPHQGVNAVQAAAEAIAWIAADARRRATEGPFVEGFDPPHTTVHVGTFQGGEILNIIPEHARFVMEWRTVPGDDAQAALAALQDHVARTIEPAMHAVDPTTGFAWETLVSVPGLSLDPRDPLTDMVRQLSGSNTAGKVSYVTEGGVYQHEAGIPTIVCGPGHIAQAHRADEYIDTTQLDACDAFIDRLAERLLA